MYARKLVCLCITVSVFCVRAGGATPAQVDESLHKATAWLLANQKNGNWEEGAAPIPDQQGNAIFGGQWTGTTALITYALLCANVQVSDSHIASAIDFLSKQPARGTYALGVRCLVWSSIELDAKTKPVAIHDMSLLLASMRTKGPARGLYFYQAPASSNDTAYDHSVSQFAPLGLWSLGRKGLEVPTNFWKLTDQAWRGHQFKDGGWDYMVGADGDHGKETLSMTTAGVATLFITQEMLHPNADCRGNTEDPATAAGIKWISDNFSGITDIGRQMDGRLQLGYTLFGLSRIGVASGRRMLGTVDWYRRGADLMIASQDPSGLFRPGWTEKADTALGVLFLAYGSAPVVANKLEYQNQTTGKPAAWNQRPQDMLNFSAWMGRQQEQRLNWQAVTLAADPEELHEAPILYVSGNDALHLSDADKQAMRRYVEDGGLILGNADCGAEAFTKGFETLGKQLFPNYEFRLLANDHPIFANEQFPPGRWKDHPRVFSLSNGVRELMMVSNQDLSKPFQVNDYVGHSSAYQLLDDIVLYAMDKKGLKTRGNTYLVIDDPTKPTTQELKLARIQYDGNWDPEPGGWRRLSALMHRDDKLKLTVTPVKLGDGQLTNYKLAHLTGTDAMKLSKPQVDELSKFVDGGGTILIDAAGGSTAFSAATEGLLSTLFGADATRGLATPLPADSPVYGTGNAAMQKVSYRSFARGRSVGSVQTPRVFGIEKGGRIVCFYSREDISAGLVGQEMDGITGYSPATAVELARHILLYSSGLGAKPTTAPAAAKPAAVPAKP
jgi:hypothetical protein